VEKAFGAGHREAAHAIQCRELLKLHYPLLLLLVYILATLVPSPSRAERLRSSVLEKSGEDETCGEGRRQIGRQRVGKEYGVMEAHERELRLDEY